MGVLDEAITSRKGQLMKNSWTKLHQERYAMMVKSIRADLKRRYDAKRAKVAR